jgi:hypothetical protein
MFRLEWSSETRRGRRTRRVASAAAVILALIVAPAPLLPPHGLAEAVQRALGVQWKWAYLLTAIGLQAGFYGSLGLLASFAVRRPHTPRKRVIRVLLLPLVVVTATIVIRILRIGHVPEWANAIVPLFACMAGALLGMIGRFRGWGLTAGVAACVAAAVLWGWTRGVPSTVARETRAALERIVAAGPGLPGGDARFAALCQTAFGAPWRDDVSASQSNRAAVLALGIAVGHERLARFAGLDRDDDLVRAAAQLRQGASLRGREDWSRHYALSGALAVVESPFLSEVGGLLKEELDALGKGTGFSFGDLAADRAGIRFADVATTSDANAEALQARLRAGFSVDDYFPATDGLPENLTPEAFAATFGGVGAPRYRQVTGEIDARIERCPGLSLRLPASAGPR